MTFSTEKEKPNSERFMLVKITPARYVSDDLALSSGVYQMDWTYNIEKVQRNGQDLTEVSSTPSTNDTWQWDGSTLKIKLASAPSSSNVIVVFYNLFYTSEKYRITTVDPEDSSTDEIHWEPRLEEEPAVKQSVRDIISGTLSTAITTLRLINVDDDFQQYLTDNDSFYEKTVKCWVCINGVGNIQKAFEGRIKTINISRSRVSITTYDIFSLLDQPCLMGDPGDEAYWLRETGSFPNVYPNDAGRPIPYILAKRSRHLLPVSFFDSSSDAKVIWGSLPRATCTNYTDQGANTDNREWGLCRLPGDIENVDYGTVTDFQFKVVSGDEFRIGIKTSGSNLEIGDPVKLVNGIIIEYAHVMAKNYDEDFGSGEDTYDFIMDGTRVDPSATFSSASHLATTSKLTIFVTTADRGAATVISPDWYTISLTDTTGGNKYLKITFTHLLEALYTQTFISGNLNPGLYEVIYLVSTASTDLNHADVLKQICESAGISTNAASFTAAESALAINTAFQIPQFDEQDFASYRKYAELICQSTMGVLFANNSFELEYQLLSTPSSSSAVTQDDYLRDSLSIEIDYQDIVTELIAYNPHRAWDEAIDAADSPSETVSSAVAEYLHGVKNTVRFRHVLEQISDRIQDIFDILSNRRAIYRFSTATKHLDSEIGDDLQLESGQLLGGVSSKDLKIISLDKSADRVDVEATDLLDI